MISDVLQSVPQIEIFAIVALILAMLVFMAMTFRVFRISRGEIDHIKRLPLDPGTPDRCSTEDRDGERGR